MRRRLDVTCAGLLRGPVAGATSSSWSTSLHHNLHVGLSSGNSVPPLRSSRKIHAPPESASECRAYLDLYHPPSHRCPPSHIPQPPPLSDQERCVVLPLHNTVRCVPPPPPVCPWGPIMGKAMHTAPPPPVRSVSGVQQ
eukprot:364546-Chlamydomonas_euryale.AAC.8